MSDYKPLSAITDEDVATLRASGHFDEQWYLTGYPDVRISRIDPARHYLWIGKKLGRAASRSELERARGIGLRWCVLATPHVLFIAHSLAENLRRHGWSVDVLLSPPAEFTHDYYIVMCAQMFDRLPPGEKRIIYQLEQSASSRWFSEKYLSDMVNSFAVLDYSLQNIAYLEGKGIAYPHVYYLPIGTSPSYGNMIAAGKDIDVLFYGDYKSCPRRQRLLDWAETRFKVVRADTVFGEEMKALIARSKLVLNLHYYEGAQLEMPRIQESLSLGTPVVSETTSDQGDYPDLNDAVTFFEAGNTEAMLAAISSVLANPHAARQAVATAAENWHRRHSFMVDRFLLGTGILPSDALDRMAPEPVTEGALYALSLPETINRRRIFDAETRTPDTRVFDGIRRKPGWIGCGMSYKYLCMSAMKAGVQQFAIMEDDALLSPNHEHYYREILAYLERNSGRWDIFSCVIAHLHDDTKVTGIDSISDLSFVQIDRMTSMIFNIYSRRAIELIANWNQNNEDSENNTIDRYLENSNLKVIVSHPYIVGHREELHSTIWGFQNTQYSKMIADSEDRLGLLKKQWMISMTA